MGDQKTVQPGYIGMFTKEELIGLLDRFFETGNRYPTKAATAQEQVLNTLMLYEIWKIAHGSRPDEGTSERDVYDKAEAGIGVGDIDEARKMLDESMIASINRTFDLADDASALGPHAPDLDKVLTEIQENKDPASPYVIFTPDRIARRITALMRIIAGGEKGAAFAVPKRTPGQKPEGGPVTAGTADVFSWMLPMHDLGPTHLITSKGGKNVFAVGGVALDDVQRLYGGDAAEAQKAVDALSNALAAEANGEPNNFGTQELLNALEGIENTAVTSSPAYQNAMDKLRAGDRSGALRDLAPLFGPGGPLNILHNTANNLHNVMIESEAFVVFSAGVSIRFEFGDNMKALNRYVRSQEASSFEPRFLYFAINMFYDYLDIMGKAGRGTYDINTGQFVSGGDMQRVMGEGHALRIRPELAAAFTLGKQLFQIVAHCDFGYLQQDMTVRVPTQGGGVKEINLSKGDPYIGLWGLEVRSPYVGAKKPLIWIERGALKAVGMPSNFVTYATLSGNWKSEGNVRVRTLFTPEVAALMEDLNEVRIGAHQLTEVAVRFKNEMELRAGAALRVTARYDTDLETTFTRIQLTPLQLEWTITPGLGVYGSVGYQFKEKAAEEKYEYEAMPGGVFGTAGLRLTPQAWFEEKQKVESVEPRKAAVPSRTRPAVTGEARRQYLGTVIYMASTDKKKRSPMIDLKKGQELVNAVDSQLLSRVLQEDASAIRLRSTSAYNEGKKKLLAGDLEGGLKRWRSLKGFQILEKGIKISRLNLSKGEG